jgi:hypothetical protein
VIPARIDPLWSAEDVCTFAVNWAIDAYLAYRLHQLARILKALGYVVQIVSGYRTIREQLLEKDGADPDVSTHTSCPYATGADLQLIGWNKTTTPTELRRVFGDAARAVGLRWGGGSELVNGIPRDWNHVDLGPRKRG